MIGAKDRSGFDSAQPRDDHGRWADAGGTHLPGLPHDLNVWEQTRPWSLDKAAVRDGRAPGFVYSARSHGEDASHGPDGIVLTDKFFDHTPGARRAILYHEAGHALADHLAAESIDLFQRLVPERNGRRDVNGQRVPHEAVAEAYSVLNSDDLRDAHDWAERNGLTHFLAAVASRARAAGMPTTWTPTPDGPEPDHRRQEAPRRPLGSTFSDGALIVAHAASRERAERTAARPGYEAREESGRWYVVRQVKSRPRPSLLVTEVKHEGNFEESKHPRDKHGRFISIGAHVDLGGGKVGEVLSATHGAITVRRDDGKTETIKGDGLRSVAVTHARTPDGGATPVSRTPVRPYAERLPRIGDVVVLNDGREGEVRHIYADGRSIKFSFVERDGSITREKVDKGTVAKITSAAPEPLAPGELPVGRMPGAMSNAQLESVPAKRSQIAALRRELDAQGVRADHPIRGVLLDAGGDYVAVARDPEGKIVGGASYSISRIGRRIDIRLMHVINQRQGIGQDLIRHIAMQSAGLPGSGQYEMSVYGAIMTAKPFYQRTGAHGDSHSGLMTWDPDTVNRLKAGDPMTPGTLDGKPYRRGKARPYLRLGDTLPPVQMTAQEMLQALIEGKHDGRFDPAKHPRDKHGRFAHIGDLVKLADGKHGRITAVGAGGKLTVRKESGGSVTVDSKKVAKVTGEASGATDARGAARALRLLPKQGRKEGTGTLDDPIAVGADIERAAHLLAEGKHVRLDQPDQVVTLVDKLRAMVADAKSRGEKAPTFDLGKVTVPGTNLFTQESKGIPRINMPQFRGVPAPGSPAEAFRGSGGESGANIEQPFRDALAAMGIPTRHATVPASHLRASQVELDGAKTAGIASGMAAGKVKDVPIFVTRDNYIIDGHHRWAAKIVHGLSGGDASMPVEVVDLDIGAALDYANAFAKVMGIASQAIDDPGSGRAPVAAATKVIYVSSVLPSDFREQMTKVLAEDAVTPSVRRRAFLAVKDIAPSAALLDGEGSGEEVPVEAAVAASPVPPRRSRIADHLAAVYAQTPRHHVVRAIDAAYARAGDPPAEDAKEA